LDATDLPNLGIQNVRKTLMRIGVDQLHPSPWQFRKEFSKGSLSEMAGSLKEAGINIVPLTVCPRKAGGWYIICGERRWRGAQIAQIHELDCLVGEYTEQQARFVSIVDNIQRDNFNPVEEARALQSLVERENMTHEEIAVAVGKSRGHVSNYIRLLQLDIQVRDLLIRGTLSPSHARLLCSVESNLQQRELAQTAVKRGWTYKTLQEKVNELLNKPKPKATLESTDANIARLERIISEETGYACVIKKTSNGNWQAGFLVTSNDQFSGLLERLGIEVEL